MALIAVILIFGGFFSFAYFFTEEKGWQTLISLAAFILGFFLLTVDAPPTDYDAIHERYEELMEFEQDARDFYEFKDAYEKAKRDY